MSPKKKCDICKKKIICPCPNEQYIRPKHRTCWNNYNVYPQAMLDDNCAEIHICSEKCMQKKSLQKEIKMIQNGYLITKCNCGNTKQYYKENNENEIETTETLSQMCGCIFY